MRALFTRHRHENARRLLHHAGSWRVRRHKHGRVVSQWESARRRANNAGIFFSFWYSGVLLQIVTHWRTVYICTKKHVLFFLTQVLRFLSAGCVVILFYLCFRKWQISLNPSERQNVNGIVGCCGRCTLVQKCPYCYYLILTKRWATLQLTLSFR